MKIVSFHYAGGNKYSYNKIIKDNHICLTISRKENNNIDKICDDILSRIINDNIYKQPYCLYGHSMGALLGYSICQKLQEKNIPMPKRLIVSGKKSPIIPRENKIANLPNDKFWDQVSALGGIPDDLLNYPELIEFYTPILKADFLVVENYQYEKKPKLNIPIDVFYGSEEATIGEMIGWQEETIEKVTITELKGNHFFIFDHIDYFKNYFKNLTETTKHSHV
jgi:external thioesterase TEII